MLISLALALASAVEAGDVVPTSGANHDMLLVLGAHAAAIAGIIRGLIAAVRTPHFAFVWNRIPLRARPLVIVALGVAAAVFEHLALGESWATSIFAAIGGVLGAVTTHEFGERVRVTPAPIEFAPSPAPSKPPEP